MVVFGLFPLENSRKVYPRTLEKQETVETLEIETRLLNNTGEIVRLRENLLDGATLSRMPREIYASLLTNPRKRAR